MKMVVVVLLLVVVVVLLLLLCPPVRYPRTKYQAEGQSNIRRSFQNAQKKPLIIISEDIKVIAIATTMVLQEGFAHGGPLPREAPFVR